MLIKGGWTENMLDVYKSTKSNCSFHKKDTTANSVDIVEIQFKVSPTETHLSITRDNDK